MSVPKYDEFYNSLLTAMRDLGGSATNQEIEDAVAELEGLTEVQLAEQHRGNRTKFSYRLAWTRNYLKRYGLLENSSRGVWSLTQKGFDTDSVDKDEVNKYVKSLDAKTVSEEGTDEPTEAELAVDDWKSLLLDKLMEMSPDSFERLCQRILRESGFQGVKVTGKSGDGGIDGHGLIKVSGLISFPVMFQCKRYKNSIGSQIVRDFRGAMQGRYSKGLIMTTATFTRDARMEAIRDGAPNIDLIDGEELVEIMKDLRLGVTVEQAENVTVENDWFAEFN